MDTALKNALLLDNEFWKIGDKPIQVITESGSVYEITSDGRITGGSKLRGEAELRGAVYRGGGPLRVGKIVIGLSIEGITINNKTLTTSPVKEIIYKEKVK